MLQTEQLPARLSPDYDSLWRTQVSQEPFPHFVVPQFLTPGQVTAVVRDFPALGMGGLFVPENTKGKLRELIGIMEGFEFRAILSEKLGIDLSGTTALVTLRERCESKDGRIHADANFKLATALLYLNGSWNSHEGYLRILRSPDDIEDYALEIPPLGGLLACFRVQKNSWHGHRPFVGQRRYIMLNYCNSRAASVREYARHYLSGKIKSVKRLFAENRP